MQSGTFCTFLAAVTMLGSACSGSGSSAATKTDAVYKEEVINGMHDSLVGDLDDLLTASTAVQTNAPSLGAWDATRDAAAIQATKDAWTKARTAYEHIEGALAPLFPDIDLTIDGRYDDQLPLTAMGDDNLFDDQGVTGLHAVERILWSDVIPANVVTFEKTLPGYQPARFPATDQEAADFKAKLCGRLITDAKTLHDQWTPQIIAIGDAFKGLVSLMNEQREKVNKASTSEEESRYSQRTMKDIRDNLEGTTKIYLVFKPWLETKPNAQKPDADGPAVDALTEAGFAKVSALYAMTPGDAIPQPPVTWSAESPSAADLASPFGVLYEGVTQAVDPATSGSIVFEMNNAATILGLPTFGETH